MSKLEYGDKITLTYTSGRTLNGTVDDIDIPDWPAFRSSDPVIVKAGQSYYLIERDGGFRKTRVHGGFFSEVSEIVGSWVKCKPQT